MEHFVQDGTAVEVGHGFRCENVVEARLDFARFFASARLAFPSTCPSSSLSNHQHPPRTSPRSARRSRRRSIWSTLSARRRSKLVRPFCCLRRRLELADHFLTPTALPYRWHQTLNELTVTIPVPAGSKSRDLIVEIKKQSLKVALKGKGPEGVIIEGQLPKEIKVDDSTWTLGACFRERLKRRPPFSVAEVV